jgi:hypothetical protein
LKKLFLRPQVIYHWVYLNNSDGFAFLSVVSHTIKIIKANLNLCRLISTNEGFFFGLNFMVLRINLELTEIFI